MNFERVKVFKDFCKLEDIVYIYEDWLQTENALVMSKSK